MMRSHSRFVSCAWAALLAMVFSALSPALAAAALRDRPAALGQMLGIPEAADAPVPQAFSSPEAAAHGAHAAHDSAPPSAPAERSAHHDHGIYCSFCLNASSTSGALASSAQPAIDTVASIALFVEPPRRAAAASYPFFRSRAPPRITDVL